MDLLLLTALAGAVLALDGTSMAQTMVSRPLVAAPVTGWLLGDPTLGLAIGALLEVYLLVSFPTGGARSPEGATAAVVAVATAAGVDAPGAVPLGVAMGLIWGQVGGLTVSGIRKVNARLVPGPEAPQPDRISAAHALAVALDGLRGAAAAVVGVALGRPLVSLLASSWPLGGTESRALLLAGGAVCAGILLRSLGGFRRHRIVLALGMAVGLVGARFL